MADIRIDTQRVSEIGRRLIAAADRMAEIGRELQSAIGNLDTRAWDGRSRARAEPLLDRVRPQGERVADRLHELGRMLLRVAEAFEEEDATVAHHLAGMGWVEFGPRRPRVGGIGIIGDYRHEVPVEDRPRLSTMAVGEEADFSLPEDARIATTMAVGEEEEFPPHTEPRLMTTLTVGEEQGAPDVRRQLMTTMAVGEEGDLPPYVFHPPVTTMAGGEEGGTPRHLRLPPVTTCAVGEEQDLPSRFESPRFTTLAVGEEEDMPAEIEFPVASTMAVGEEEEDAPRRIEAILPRPGRNRLGGDLPDGVHVRIDV